MTALAPKNRSTGAPAPTGRLLCYLRQSIGENRNTHGVDAQRGICQRFAVANSLPWDSRIEFVDVGFSRDDANRPEYKKLLGEAREGDTILVWERSRLGVDLAFVVAVAHLTKQCGARILVASGDPIDASELGLVMEHLRGNSDGGELRRIRTRTREKLRERVLAGFVASKLPFGLETYPANPGDPSSWKLGRKVPAEEEVILRAVRLYLDGWGWQRIARQFNREGIRSPRGEARTMVIKKGLRAGQTVTTTGRWSGSHISDIMVNPTYRGRYVFGERGGKGGKIEPITVEHPEWLVGDLDMWARVDAAMAARTTDMRSKLNSATHALSGIGKCACGGSLMVLTDGRKGRRVQSYTCSRRLRGGACDAPRFRARKQMLEAAIAAGMTEWFDAVQAALLEAEHEVTTRVATATAPDASGIEAELAAERVKQARLAKVVAMSDGSIDALMDELKAGQLRVKRLEAELARAKAPQTDAAAVARQVVTAAVQRLDALREALRGPDAREALRTLFPQGIGLRAAPDAFHVEAIGVLTTEGNSDGFPREVRTPFHLTIPRRAA